MLGCPSGTLRRHISRWEARLQHEMLAGMEWQPWFCLIMPIGPNRASLERARMTLGSLAGQTYPNWRLNLLGRWQDTDFEGLVTELAAGEATLPCLRLGAVARLRQADAVRQTLTEGIGSHAERVGFFGRRLDRALSDLAKDLEAAASSFVMLLHPGDELGGDALAELAIETGLHRDAEFLYGDEEALNVGSGQIEAFHKPDWSPDLLLATNYLGRVWCASAGLIERIGMRTEDLLRRGDYDLVLRCTEQAKVIRHLPAVLGCRAAAPAAPANDTAALQGALRRRGIDGRVEPGRTLDTYRIRRRLAAPPVASIIICTRGARGLIKTCLETLHKVTAYPRWEVIAVENIPPEHIELKTWLRRTATKVIEITDPFNWALFNNRAAAEAGGDVLVFLNDDIEITDPSWLDTLVTEAMRPEVGVVGPQLLYPNGTVQHAGMFLEPRLTGKHSFRDRAQDDPGYFGLALTQRNVAAVTGACLATRREVFERLGPFETAHQIVMNDLDYCLKVHRAGLLAVYTPFATLIHHERASREYAPEHYDRALFRREWETAFAEGDPYHPPALSTRIEDMIADPEPAEAIGAERPLFDRAEIRKIVILQLGPVEDAIASIPAIRRLHALLPAARLTMVAGAATSHIWASVPELHDIVPFEFYHQHPHLPRPGLVPDQIEALAARLAPECFDIAIDIDPCPESRVLLRFAGARYTAGFDGDPRFGWLDIAREWRGDSAGQARAESIADARVTLVDAIATASDEPGPVLTLPESGAAPLCWSDDLRARPVIGVYPGAARAIDQWPPEYFATLIDWLIERDGVHIALLGETEDRADIAAVARQVAHSDRVWPLTGAIPADGLPQFLSHCALVVGNDGASLHLAAALGIPTVALYSGRRTPQENGATAPRAVALRRHVSCTPCHLADARDCPRHLDCLIELRPRDVYPVCQRLLAINGRLSRPVRHHRADAEG